MENKYNESGDINRGNRKNILKGQEILKTTLNSIELEREKYRTQATTLLLNSTTYKNNIKLNTVYNKYKSYLSYSKQAFKRHFIIKYHKFNEELNFRRYPSKNQLTKKQKRQFYINKIFVAKLNFIYYVKNKLRKLKNIIETARITFLQQKIFNLSAFLNKILKVEKYLFRYLKVLTKNYKNLSFLNFNYFKNKNIFAFISNKISNNTKFLLQNLEKYKNSFNKNLLLSYLNRFGFILKIYFLPFIFLANQALVPFIQEYEELIVSSFSCQIFEKIPFLTTLIKLFNPIINSYNKMVQFWVIIAYFLIFPTGYRSLKLSYKLGYNGSIAFIFLLINYSLGLSQEIAITIFESLKLIKDIIFSNYLIKHLNRIKYKEKEETVSIFTNLVQRYELQIKHDYFNWLLFLNHFILSPLAFISMVILLYNCFYYIIYNKNPKIPLVTKAALATIKNPQEEE